MEQQLLTVEDAAEVLAVSRSRAYELIASGELASVSIGRSRRVPVRAIEQFVQAKLDEAGSK